LAGTPFLVFVHPALVRCAHGVAISMDWRGRFSDNIFVERLWRSLKYEEVVCCESFIGDGE
jgi:hypothetical protein